MSSATVGPVLSLDQARRLDRATLTLTEAASLLGVDPRTVSAAAAANEIPNVRIGRRVLIPREAFLALFEPARGRVDPS